MSAEVTSVVVVVPCLDILDLKCVEGEGGKTEAAGAHSDPKGHEGLFCTFY